MKHSRGHNRGRGRGRGLPRGYKRNNRQHRRDNTANSVKQIYDDNEEIGLILKVQGFEKDPTSRVMGVRKVNNILPTPRNEATTTNFH